MEWEVIENPWEWVTKFHYQILGGIWKFQLPIVWDILTLEGGPA